MKYYISGSIEHDRNHKVKFSAAAEKLEKRKYQVINPCEAVEKKQGKKWLRYVIECLELIEKENPDGIYLLRTWAESDGANIERIVFKHLGKKIMAEREDA